MPQGGPVFLISTASVFPIRDNEVSKVRRVNYSFPLNRGQESPPIAMQRAEVFNEGWRPVLRRPDYETAYYGILEALNSDADVAFERRIVVTD